MKHAVALCLTTATGAVIIYLSRFWFVNWWDRPGLFGLETLPPRGKLLGTWLRGTDFAPFELLIWALGVFAVLSLLHKLRQMFFPGPDAE